MQGKRKIQVNFVFDGFKSVLNVVLQLLKVFRVLVTVFYFTVMAILFCHITGIFESLIVKFM